jgi:hypothetical protein
MALIQCDECKREVSDMAFACPGCGAPIKPVPQPASQAETQEAVMKGHQRSSFKQGLGNAIAIFSVIVAFPVGMASSFQAGAGVAFVGCAIGVAVAYL